MELDVAVIGAGSNPDDPDRDGYAMGYRHARAYETVDGCRLVACADVVPSNARAFADTFDVAHVYEDYEEMLQSVTPDVVSVCVPPHVHAEVMIGCAESGVPRAIHCEKPMATTWGDCRRMAAVADEHDVQLTINHQRRFGAPFRTAKTLLEEGAIGELRRIEFSTSTLFDSGSHLFDLANFFVDQTSAEWVIGQVDYREENIWFGAHNENQGLVQWKYTNGVFGLASTGRGVEFLDCYMRLIGDGGAIELGVENGPSLRVRRTGGNWETVSTDRETIHGSSDDGFVDALVDRALDTAPFLERSPRTPSHVLHTRAIESVIEALRTSGHSELDKSLALDATELIFAGWESARRVGRVDLPLEIDDNPLESMIAEGRLLSES